MKKKKKKEVQHRRKSLKRTQKTKVIKKVKRQTMKKKLTQLLNCRIAIATYNRRHGTKYRSWGSTTTALQLQLMRGEKF